MARPRFEQFYAVRRFQALSDLSFSPDGDQVAYVHDGSGQMNLWRQSVEGGWPSQLTVLEEDVARQHRWTPHGFVVGIDRHGSEQSQLNRVPAAGGWPKDLTGRTDVQFLVGHLHPDGRRLTVAGNATRRQDRSVYVLDVLTGELAPLVEDEGSFFPGPWHPDGRRLAVTRQHSNTNRDVFLLDVLTGERTELTPHDGDEANQPVGFSADGGGLYVVTDRGHDFDWLGLLPLAGGREPEPVWRGDWGVESARIDREARRLVWAVNDDGRSTFRARDLATGRDLPVPDLPSGWCTHISLSADGRRLAALIGTATRPMDVYIADLDAGTTTRLTYSFLGGIPEQDLVEPELVRYPTFDGRLVPGWLYRPRDVAGRVPSVLSIHGGPEAQARPGGTATFALFQYLVSRGVAVLAPNIRGSTGYGRAYQRLIHRDWGGGELRDIEASACYLRDQSWIDPDRVAVHGASFGGFATLSAMTRLPRYWACGVDLFGPSNLLTFARSVPPFWRHMMRAWVGDPDDDAELLRERSPISYLDGVRAPLMVLQGANDPRVVKAESDQVVERLRGMGREVAYRVFDDEGHGFTKTANQLAAARLLTDFLFEHLGVEA
jgi:dipeptidyl aminopeptidase/acylaminoacyl peptidase